MPRILIAYASHEGHTRTVVDRLAARLRGQGLAVETLDLRRSREPVDLSDFSAALVAGSVHLGAHDPTVVAFGRRHREALERIPSGFLSVGLREADAEDPAATMEERAAAIREVEGVLGRFFEETGWQPENVLPVAGSLAYTRYNPVKRWMMKRSAGRLSTDTSHDHVYTDWAAVDRFTDEFARAARAGEAAGRPVPRDGMCDPANARRGRHLPEGGHRG